jgi:uncharacterized membrane protein YqgA involved in biofilm formation
MYGTIINSVAIILGSAIGVLFQHRFPKKIQLIVFQGLGLSTLLIGLQMAQKVDNILTLIFSLLIGGIIGESINLELQMEHLGNWFKSKVKSKDAQFTDGFVAASVLFCVGAMAILGSLDEGIRGDRTVLLTKSILDGFASIALAASMGIGVAFSAIPILLYQGSITILARYTQGFFTPLMIHQLTAVGGLLIVGISINLLEIKKIKVTNLLPSLILIILFSLFIK